MAPNTPEVVAHAQRLIQGPGAVAVKMHDPARSELRKLMHKLRSRGSDRRFADGHVLYDVPRPRFLAVVDEIVRRHGPVLVHIEFSRTQVCDVRCVRAKGDECECSCLGQNHGGGEGLLAGWVPVGDTTLISSDVVGVKYLATEPRRKAAWGGGR